jgi:hypothetical protein
VFTGMCGITALLTSMTLLKPVTRPARSILAVMARDIAAVARVTGSASSRAGLRQARCRR